MPVKEGWKRFNRSFHHFFITDLPQEQARARSEMLNRLAHMDVHGARETMQELLCLAVWNRVHRVEDAVWDPRGKRALFAGTRREASADSFSRRRRGVRGDAAAGDVSGRGSRARRLRRILQDRSVRTFPEAYPFLGVDPATGHKRVWYREEMPIHYEVADIRDLTYGRSSTSS